MKEKKDSNDSKGLFQRINDGLYQYYVAPYRRTFARAQRDEEDRPEFLEDMGITEPTKPMIYAGWPALCIRMAPQRQLHQPDGVL